MTGNEYQQLANDFEVAFLERGRDLFPSNLRVVEALAFAYTRAGRYSDGLAMDRILVAEFPHSPLIHYNLACSLCLTGALDDAVDALLTSIDLGYRDFDHLLNDPDLSALQEHSRMIEVLRAAGIEPGAEESL